MAFTNDIHYVWIDTCCIDKTSSSELSEAINSMYCWYREARVCYAFLADIKTVDQVPQSQWFTRGWTLQELIASAEMTFFNQDWRELGSKKEPKELISGRTGIATSILDQTADLESVCIAQRMSWAAKRETARLEDQAYCLLGIFGINMPMLYGEGKNAFIRLQEEILRISSDESIFAWKSSHGYRSGLLADPPSAFEDCADITIFQSSSKIPWNLSNKGL
ncbi:hypothetical protein ASPWEDRAFT_44873 [Aspergillus wentii DTO 134E9]|uniref:Uncharacterized protein n=1 Tax=Aspergillus wentii DTO 134E9 TaxID=1073089 RepID=A0A1L9R7K3_ASPWE|nr:uncharacterized protein ASPWEDRAFT_44873 [Aspergillus wentii DTO 134E9]OJJ30900.1 hypothetical protein ASPWEDRAFT_44873 [Aspergillus wentii DTO 134E9]